MDRTLRSGVCEEVRKIHLINTKPAFFKLRIRKLILQHVVSNIM